MVMDIVLAHTVVTERGGSKPKKEGPRHYLPGCPKMLATALTILRLTHYSVGDEVEGGVRR